MPRVEALALYRQAATLDTRSFRSWLTNEIRTELPFDMLWRCGLMPQQTGRWQVAWVDPVQCAEGMVDDFVRVRHLVPYPPQFQRLPGMATASSPLQAIGGRGDLQPYQDFLQHYAIHHLLGWTGVREGAGVATVLMARSRTAGAFRDHDIVAANVLLPHVCEACHINLALNGAHIARGASDTGLVVLTPSGLIVGCSDKALSLMRSEWPDWHPPRLPEVLRPLSDGFVGAYHPGRSMTFSFEQREQLYLMTISDRRPGSLTARQWAIARLIANGYTYGKTAELLGLATATVRNQLHLVYRKLGISNRGQLHEALTNRPQKSPGD